MKQEEHISKKIYMKMYSHKQCIGIPPWLWKRDLIFSSDHCTFLSVLATSSAQTHSSPTPWLSLHPPMVVDIQYWGVHLSLGTKM